MTLVRFAFVCDNCGARGPEYGSMGHCVECGDDVCEKCATKPADPENGKTICRRCDDKRFEDQDLKRDAAEDAERAFPDREWRFR